MTNSKVWAVIGSDTHGVSYSSREIDPATGILSGGWYPQPNGTYIDPKGKGTNVFTILQIVDSKRKGEKIRDLYYAIAEIAGKTKLQVNA